ncbi:hypothetical protein ALC56_02512, partial [Trachymyrmex septentrionalis]
LMLDIGSGPNVIKETFISKDSTIDYNILKLNGINEYPIYTLGKMTLSVFGKEVIFHIVSNDFPISQAGILGNDFFEQNSSKIDYAKVYIGNKSTLFVTRNHYCISALGIFILRQSRKS